MSIQNQTTGEVIYQFQDRLLNRPIRFTWVNTTHEQCLRIRLHNLRVRLVSERARAKANGDASKFRDLSSRGNGALLREIREMEMELAELKQSQGMAKTSLPSEDSI